MTVAANQHYVPRVYLQAFASDDKIHVFDKTTFRSFATNIKNVACEKYFYDIPQKYPGESAEVQLVEKYLSTLEGRFGQCRNALIGCVEAGKRIGYVLREEFAHYMVLQLLRTKTQRAYLELPLLDDEFFKDKADAGTVMPVPEDHIALEHARLMFSPRLVGSLTEAILSHIWVVGINASGRPLYTSDSPVVRYPHVYDPVMGTSGVKSVGIELDFPLSPKHVVMIAERSFHRHLARWENGAFPVSDERCIYHLNRLQVYEAYRQVYCDQPGFTDALKFLRAHPEFAKVDRPRLEIVSPRPIDRDG